MILIIYLYALDVWCITGMHIIIVLTGVAIRYTLIL